MIPYLPLAIFTLLYWMAALVRAFSTGNSEFLMYIGQMGVIVGLVAWAHRYAKFSHGVLWLLSIWGLMHLAGGVVPVPPEMAQINDDDKTKAALYGLWIIPPHYFKYDNLVHMFGFFAATLAVAQALRPFLAEPVRPRLALFVILTSAGMGLGAVNEMIEFIATVVFPETNVGDYHNNALDLCWNAIGAMAAAGVAMGMLRKKPAAIERQA